METIFQKFYSVLSDSSVSGKPRVPKFLNLSYKPGPISFLGSRKPRRSLNLRMARAPQDLAIHQQKVIIPNKQQDKLVGILHDSGTLEIVILCHGLGASKEDNIMVNLASALGKSGISSFRFDFTGNGESEGSFGFGNYCREVDDLNAVIQHFHEANRRVIAIIGHSKGANVVLLYASKYHDIKTVFNLSGRYNLMEGIEERLGKDFMDRIRKEGFIEVKINSGSYRVTEESLKDRLSINMREECLKIDKECRVFTVHGSADQAIPVRDAYEFTKILPNHKLHIIEGANHIYSDHQAELTSVVVNFLKETLHQGNA
ncbi:uncharacterized protein LOC129309512 isoform X1 [Prosopis cineraria]|uniref:uncharacterized protein LOC129309512 isoform X1 n=2 Tax=Prosopis cineraria TaxID=364024 RepID=UPI002410A9B2|nr:uncharacterized protein LOC129309512 isoform X1 [Prosopis cineraria]